MKNYVVLSTGLSIIVAQENLISVLPLPIGGLMSNGDGYQVAQKYTYLDALAKKLSSWFISQSKFDDSLLLWLY